MVVTGLENGICEVWCVCRIDELYRVTQMHSKPKGRTGKDR